MDHHLYTSEWKSKKTVLWRPGDGNSVVLRETDYRPFSHVVRTVHIPDALTICADHKIAPRPITSLCTLNAKKLHWQRLHPCRNLRVLWFGAKLDGNDEDSHDWYGNIEFTITVDVLLQRWKNFYLVEMMTVRSQTLTRILVTNADYSSVLPQYDPCAPGGPWRLNADGRQECLVDCRRYNSDGYNRHGHKLEFMIEVTEYGMQKILEEAVISFKNHHLGRNGGPHDCHRFGKTLTCPTPFTSDLASLTFFREHHRLIMRQPMATPTLSPSAEEFRRRFLAAEEIPRNTIQVPPPLPLQHFLPLASAGQESVIFSKFLRQQLKNGRIRMSQLMLGITTENVFSILAESIRNPNLVGKEEWEVELLKLVQHRHHRMPPLGLSIPANLAFPPFPSPTEPPPLHLPPPPVFCPPIFQHSWAPMQPIPALK